MAGFVGLLLVLCGFSLWAVVTTNRAAVETARLTNLNDAFQRAQFAHHRESAATPVPRASRCSVRASFEQAAGSFTAAVRFVQLHGDSYDQAPLDTSQRRRAC
jgi:hypothetical protein